ELGWGECDVVLVTGDAYVDHPSFGVALIGRLLEEHGFRVGIIDQPDWHSAEPFRALGKPALFFGVTAGVLDSMVNIYTADLRLRKKDAYSPDERPGMRPRRAAIVYAQRCREAFGDVPVVLGGIEASLRRFAHYDYWSDEVRRSVLLDSKADILLYGNAERAVVELAHRLAAGEKIASIDDIPGTAFVRRRGEPVADDAIRLPYFDEVRTSPAAQVTAARMAAGQFHNKKPLVQAHGDRDVWVLPPAEPLAEAELDRIYELPFTRLPHPKYRGRILKAWETVRHSITILRGCFGGCSFCALAAHEGPVIQSRSIESVLREIERIRDTGESFTGVITDLGGPTANMYRMKCTRPGRCGRPSCLHPSICRFLDTDHGPLVELYRKAAAVAGVRKVLIGSGVRYDLALTSPEYIRQLCTHHVGGYLKVAPEHVAPEPLRCMQKPPIEVFERFMALFNQYSREAGLEQYLIPYLIAGHPGSRDEDMARCALWLKRHGFRPQQVQNFMPGPMTYSTIMYATGLDPLRPSGKGYRQVFVPRGAAARRR
ncbi:MAG: YgiQ family radical SAM protein, partial [Deltaproteobacteria bacterium]